MSKLNEYLRTQAQCITRDADMPDAVDVVHFKVAARPTANAAILKELILEHPGEFCSVDVFDGDEHGYIELGGWLGNQQDALVLIGLGTQLGLWHLLSPRTMLGQAVDDETEKLLAGQGLISLQAPRQATGVSP